MKKLRKKIILGVHLGYLHDSGAALIIDNKIKALVAVERVSRIKKDCGFPKKAIFKCLEIANIALSDVTHYCMAAKDIQYQPKPAPYFKESGDVHEFIRNLNQKESITRTNSNMILKEYKNSSYIEL